MIGSSVAEREREGAPQYILAHNWSGQPTAEQSVVLSKPWQPSICVFLLNCRVYDVVQITSNHRAQAERAACVSKAAMITTVHWFTGSVGVSQACDVL